MIDQEIVLVRDRKSPYMAQNAKNMEEYFEAYRNDPCATINQNGSTFYRVITSCQLQKGDERWILINIDSKIGISPWDVFEDENGHRFKYMFNVHYKFNGLAPKWYFETPEIVLEGSIDELGEYLRNTKAEDTRRLCYDSTDWRYL